MQPIETYKLQGELVELRFLARAAELGLRVSKPYGDSAPYDFLVESGGTVYKVQVKSTSFRNAKCRAYVCATHRQGIRYSKKDVDFIAAYIVSEDAWYIIPLSAIRGREVSLNPRFRRNKYRRYREAWDLLIPERRNRRRFRKPKLRRSRGV
ncbi:MAG TPA: group I intron-associated PD-(D/E)XK endonuclease [Terriglobales bacterium]